MSLRSTGALWGSVTRLLHWSTALVVLGMLTAGLYADRLDTSTPVGDRQFHAAINIHKSFGMLLLLLVTARLLWRLTEDTPSLQAMVPLWQRVVARTNHLLLYAGLFVMLISGYVMASSHGEPPRLLGFRLPLLPTLPGSWEEVAHETHHTAANLLIALIAFHVLGALKNHFVDKNDVLHNMAGLAPTGEISPEPVVSAEMHTSLGALER